MKLPGFHELSKEQVAIHNLPLKGCYLVTGPPGTGKTIIALFRSQMIEKRGRTPDIIMFNGLLKRYTKAALETLGVGADAKTFHQWFYGAFYNEYSTSVQEISKYHPDWDFVMEILGVMGDQALVSSDLIVDEGQDLPPQAYSAARVMAESVTVFADENQTITSDNATFDQIRSALGPNHAVLRLQRNYRNTLQIAGLAECFFTHTRTGVADLPTRVGPKPEIRQVEGFEQAMDLIRVYEANNDRQEIGVFVTNHERLRAVKDALEGTTKNETHAFFGNKGSGDMALGKPGIRMMCSESAKGLEFDAVFIPEAEAFSTYLRDQTALKRRFYVMTSRARDTLFILWSGSREPAYLKSLPEDVVERRKVKK